jgi:hypothetical protein
MSDAIMIVPNTKDGLEAISYLRKQIVENGILIKLVSKREFDLVVKNYKGDKNA